MQKAKKQHLHQYQSPDGESETLILRIPSWLETRDVRASMAFRSQEYRATELYKQSVEYWEALKAWNESKEGDHPVPVDSRTTEEEHAAFLAWQECGLGAVVDLVEGLEGSDLTGDEVREVLRQDVRYQDVLRTLRDTLFFQRGLYESVGRVESNGGAPEVGASDEDGTGQEEVADTTTAATV